MNMNYCKSFGLPWCITIYSFLVLSIILFLLTIFQYYLIYKESQHISLSKKLVFLSQSLQTCAMCLHYAFLGDDFNIIFLLQESFLNVQYSLVFYYFFIQLSENMRSLLRTKIPLIAFNLITFLGFLLYLLVSLFQNQNIYKCNSGVWVYLHSCGMVLSLIFIYLGYHTGKHLYIVAKSFNLIVNNDKIKHFWIIIVCMTVASITNVAESVYFIDINNDDCYNSYSRNPMWDLIAFIVIRVFSHYLFLFSCLYVFRIERRKGVFSYENTESCKSLFHPYDESQENSWICSSPTTHLDIDLPETPISSRS